MRRGKKIVAAIMGIAMLAGLTLGAGRVNVAAAEEERVYQEKYDKIFEDFNREDISDTVTFSGTVEDSGKSYLEVTYGAETTTPDDAIYKQALPGESNRGNLVIIMRSPDGSAALEDIILGTRYNDSFPVYGKSLAELNDANLDALPELTEEYQKYIINFANSYEDDEVYEGSEIQVNSGIMVGFHLYSAEGAEGTIEISKMYFTTDDSDNVEAARTMLNHFMGGDKVDVTAKESSNGTTWWCGSATGIIRQRSITLEKDATMEVICPDNQAGEYKYAVIEAEGDVEHLLVATHNGSFSELAAYTGSVAVESGNDGFRLKAGEGAVTIHRIFYTNFEEEVIATSMPRFDVESVQLLDHFNVAQTVISGDYDEMSTRPEMAASNLYYRLSYNNSDKVRVENGSLIFDASALAENDYINFKTESMTPCTDADYIVLKAKAEDGASLAGFRFGIGGDVIWGNGGLVSATGLPAASLDDAEYVYRTADGYSYIVVDIAESGLGMPAAGVSMIDMYYSGTGRLYVDEIFCAKKQEAKMVTTSVCQTDAVTWAPDAEGYQYLAYVSAMNDAASPYLVLRMSGTEGASLDSVRLEFKNKEDATIGVFWFSENEEGTLRGMDGAVLPVLTTTAQDYVIDLAKTGIGTDIGAFHVHSGGNAVGGQITLEQVSYAAVESIQTTTECSTDAVTWAPDAEGYQYLAYVSAMNDAASPYLVLRMSGTEGASLDSVRLEFKNKEDATIGVFWFSENEEGTLRGMDGAVLPVLTTTAQDYVIDLAKTGIGTDIGAFHVHSGGNAVGGQITLEKVSYAKEAGMGYAEIMAALPVYEVPDMQAPVVTLEVPASATAGDTVTVAADAADDSGNVEVKVTVVKDGAEITLNNGTFVAEEGVYTITVTAVDAAENETSEVRQLTVEAKAAEPTEVPEPTEAPKPTETPEPTKAADTEDKTSTPVNNEEPGTGNTGLIIGIAAVVLILAVAAVVIVLKKKKEK